MLRIARNLVLKQNRVRLSHIAAQRFGGAAQSHGEDHHDDHHEVVELYRGPVVSNQNVDKDLVGIYGFKDVNYEHHEDETDPYAHLRNYPKLSLRRWFFADPYYVPDEDEPLMNEPHGYLTNDDPLDTRSTYERPFLELMLIMMVAVTLGLSVGTMSLRFRGPSLDFFDQNVTAEYLEEEIRKIRIQNQELVDLRDKLRAELSE